jgi:hypothetical protein
MTPTTHMIRSAEAGVFYGTITDRDGDTVTMTGARRVWFWDGAATLSELATRGTSKPDKCKFPAATSGEHVIFGVCEIIEVTPEARATLDAVPVWTA